MVCAPVTEQVAKKFFIVYNKLYKIAEIILQSTAKSPKYLRKTYLPTTNFEANFIAFLAISLIVLHKANLLSSMSFSLSCILPKKKQ